VREREREKERDYKKDYREKERALERERLWEGFGEEKYLYPVS
jgi:hypothetical protein